MTTETAMPKIQKFEDLIVWQKSQDLTVSIYQHFAKCKDFPFKDEICRSSVAISSKIAGAYGQKFGPDFLQLLTKAQGSSNQLKSLLHLAGKIGHLDEQILNTLLESSDQVSKLLYGLTKSIRNGKKSSEVQEQ